MVFPAYAGVIRAWAGVVNFFTGISRIRGGDPGKKTRQTKTLSISRTRGGDPAGNFELESLEKYFPHTRGVILKKALKQAGFHGISRIRGGDPIL